MDDGNYVDAVLEYVVDDTVRPFDDLTHVFASVLGYHPSGVWEVGDLFGAGSEPVDEIAGVDR